MNLKQLFENYKRYILFYCLIWFCAAFFLGQRHSGKDYVDTLTWLVTSMIIDAPAIFFTVLYIFPKYLKPEKIVQLIISVGFVNIVTVFAYYGLHETFGIGKFAANFTGNSIGEVLLKIQRNGFTEALYTVLISSLMLSIKYYDFRQKFLELEKEKAQAELKLLQAQVNPHFLFNNLNVLSSLVKKDTDMADEFITRFSKLYRYLLKSKTKDFVTLQEELECLEDYLFLLEKRFGEAYQINNKIGENMDDYSILPASIQGLIENAVKHNEGYHAAPLKIEMYIKEDHLVVSNEVRPKFVPAESMGTGLDNLNTRYKLLANTSIRILNENGKFEVQVPLLKSLIPTTEQVLVSR